MIKSQHQFFLDFIRKTYPEAVEACWIPGLELQFYPDQAAADREDGLGEGIYSCHRNSSGRMVIDEDF